MALRADWERKILPAQEHEQETAVEKTPYRDFSLRWLTTFMMLVFPTAVLFINRADSYTYWLLVLIGIWVWLRHGAQLFLDRWSAALLLACAVFFGVTVLAYLFGFQTQDGFHFLGRYLRFLFIAPVYLAFRRYPPTAKTVFIGLAIGALAGGIVSVWHFLHVHHFIRMEAATDLSIIFGDLATTMTLSTVAGFGLMAVSRRTWSVPLLILSLAGGVAATLLSGTRGAWIPLLLLPLILMTPVGGFLKRRYLFAIMLVLIAVFSSLYFMGRSGTQERITDAARDLRDYVVALSVAQDYNKPNFASMHCGSDAAFLQIWLDEAYVPGNLEAQVVPTDSNLAHDAHNCRTHYAVRLRNIKGNGLSSAAFQRVGIDDHSQQRTSLWLRGTGTLEFAGTKRPAVDFSSQEFRRVTAASDTATGDIINVGVAPHQSVELVPQDEYFGEYSMSIANNSVGQRLELWRAAWHLFLAHPWLGVGTGAYQPSTQSLINAGKIAPFVAVYDHPHNDYFNALASFGVVGAVALLAVLLLPAWFFVRAVRGGERVTHALGLAGLFTVIGFAIYALTDVVFLHNMMIIWYVTYSAMFFALIQTQADKSNNGVG